MDTLYHLLDTRSHLVPEAPALLAPGRPALTYRALHTQVARLASGLAASGVERSDRVAIVLPNGPEAALAFLGAASVATAAPLNPAYGREELDFFLTDLQPKVLLVAEKTASIAGAAAEKLGIKVLPWSFASAATDGPADNHLARPEDVALVLHTSGTTSRPKIVPLTQENLVVSARQIAASLELTASDRCLNVMPLFHIHGLVAAVLASLAAKGSVVCSPGFDAASFGNWSREHHPTWYTAVPTMHQAVLGQLQKGSAREAFASLRFARSCSSALPPRLMADLEAALGVPVIEAYGMTEASHQMSSNPLPPHQRKPGSVGLATGVSVAVMDGHGNLLAPGKIGEVVIRGRSVTSGYASPVEANATAFSHGWFRTGDQGYLDEEGYLFLTGRIKEIINRGGEKISPREIDEVMLDHPAVAQAVAFALPHPTLGEDIGLAVVPRPGAPPTECELREFAFGRLAAFKVPSKFVVVDSIPKGPTGKLQRIGLAEKLKDRLHGDFQAPEDPIEELIADIWREVLDIDRVGINDNFFATGGDSLRGARVVNRVNELFVLDLPITAAFRRPTIREFAAMVREAADPGRIDEIHAIIKEVESLSDEQVEGLIAEEDAARSKGR